MIRIVSVWLLSVSPPRAPTLLGLSLMVSINLPTSGGISTLSFILNQFYFIFPPVNTKYTKQGLHGVSFRWKILWYMLYNMLYIKFIIYQIWCCKLKMIYDKFYWFSRLITGLRASTYLAKFLCSWQKLNLVSQSIWIDQHNIHLIFSQPPRGSGRHFRWLAGFYCCPVRHKRTPPPQCVTKGCRDKCTKDLQENIFLLSIQAPVRREL